MNTLNQERNNHNENCKTVKVSRRTEKVVPAAKRIGADMLEVAAPEIGEVISGGKSFETIAKSVAKQTLKKQMSSGSKQRRIIPTKFTKQSS